MPVGAAVGIAGAGLATGAMSASAQKDAGKTVAASTDRAAELENQRWLTTLGLAMPGYNRAEEAADVYGAALGLPGSNSPLNEVDYAAYVQNNPDLLNEWRAGRFGGGMSAEDVGELHYLQYGKDEGRLADTRLMTQVRNTPGYQAQLDAGIKSIDRAAPMSGGMVSGRRLKALQNHGQQTFGSYYDSWMNRVGGVAGQAPQIAQNIGQAGMQSAANQGGLMVQGATARANGQVSSANAWSGAIGDVASGVGWLGAQKGWFGK